MSNGNSITVVGNVTRDPEMRFTPTGQPSVTFGLAVNRRWQNRQTQDWEEATSFFDVVCWRELAENAAETFKKGARIIVTGRLEQRSWSTQEGEKRSKVEIVADDIGPSLRFASAEIKKNEKKQPAEGGAPGRPQWQGQGQDGAPAPTPAPAARPEPDASYAAYDEEPF